MLFINTIAMKKIYRLLPVLISLLLIMSAAITKETKAQSNLIHFWYFNRSLPNDTPFTEINATYSTTAVKANLEYQSALAGYPFTSTDANWRKASLERRNAPTPLNYRPVANGGLPYSADDMRGVQVKQPFRGDGGENTLIFHLPTTGVRNVVFSFAAINEGAADALIIDYSTAEGTPAWSNNGMTTSNFALENAYKLYVVDFSSAGFNIAAANNNPNFKIRIRFDGSNLTQEGTNIVTFNNFSLDGEPMEGNNLPPVVQNPISFQKLIQNTPSDPINLNQVFSDPENDALTFTASSNIPAIVSAQINGSNLILNPLRAAEATITVSANDGTNPAVSTTFRVLVYPEPFNLGQGDFLFQGFNSNEPEYTYPANMLFMQSDRVDPPVDYNLLFPYYIPHDDYHADDQTIIGFPYMTTGRTRINGLGANGISFINTGRNRDLGGALVALNTQGQQGLVLGFVAGTILKNTRIYAFRVQYRTDIDAPFQNLMLNNQPVEYVAANDGDSQTFSNIPIPQALLDQPYVQLLWRYYLKSGDTGSRSQLRLDNITVSRTTETLNPEDLSLFRIFTSRNAIFVENNSGEKTTMNIFNITGQKVYSTTIEGFGLKKVDFSAVNGIYIVSLQSSKGNFTRKIVLH
jgi:hypothetical protein